MKHHDRRRAPLVGNDIAPVMASIFKSFRSEEFTDLEKQRFSDDLVTLSCRLTSREYLQSSFKPRNQLSIPDRTEEFYKDLGFFYSVGKVWESLLKKLKYPRLGSVLDIGPGYFPKVELGLYYAGFNGTVTMLDQDSNATASAEKFLSFFNCPFTVRRCHSSILDAPKARYDLVTANHFLDDFCLATHCQDHQIDIREAYLSETLYRALWADIAKDSSSALSGAEELAATLTRLLNPGGTVLLLDYTSFSHRALGLSDISTCVNRMKKLLLVHLRKQGMIPRSHFARPLKFGRLQISAVDLMRVTKTKGRKASENV